MFILRQETEPEETESYQTANTDYSEDLEKLKDYELER